MTEKRFTLIEDTGTDECYTDNLYDNGTYIGAIAWGSKMICYLLNDLSDENGQLKKEKEYWKSNACSQSNYLSILSMDCWIVEEAILNLKNVIDVDTEAYNLLDELSDKFNELQEHRINWAYSLSEEEKQDVIKYLRAYND